jgi:hypothetical protein
MEVKVIQDAYVLTPNKEHENFTETEELIHAGTILNGEPRQIKGKRRGADFTYKLFKTKQNKFIHLNKIQPMRTTEVLLGADSKQTPTIVDIPATKKMFTKNVIIGTLLGAGVGYYYSAKMKKMENKKVIMYSVGGAIAGFLSAKWFEKRKGIVVKPSK